MKKILIIFGLIALVLFGFMLIGQSNSKSDSVKSAYPDHVPGFPWEWFMPDYDNSDQVADMEENGAGAGAGGGGTSAW